MVRAKFQRPGLRMLMGFLATLVLLLAIHYYSRARTFLQLPSPGLPLPLVTFIQLIFN